MHIKVFDCHSRGFTLVECLAGIAVLGAMGVVVGPIGSSVRAQSLDTESQMVHHRLARHQMMYIADHNGAFSGPNTSGLEWNRFSIVPGQGLIQRWRQLEGVQSSSTPTSLSDWISPIAGDAVGFSGLRAERARQILDVFGDPTATSFVDSLYSADAALSDISDFEEVFQKAGYRQGSFLMMRSFTHFSAEHPILDSMNDGGSLNYQAYVVQSPGVPALAPEGYSPSIWNVGTQPSNKVMFADGTRYFEDKAGLSMDIDSEQGVVSGHTSTGPVFGASIAYGRESLQAPSQANTDLSFRKNGGAGMYATMFDGSLRYFSRQEAWTNPTPWYPGGSSWQGIGATPESQAWVDQNLPDGIIP